MNPPDLLEEITILVKHYTNLRWHESTAIAAEMVAQAEVDDLDLLTLSPPEMATRIDRTLIARDEREIGGGS